jgi:hypothetical protein
MANKGMANKGMANKGMANKGMANKGMANKGMVVGEGMVIEAGMAIERGMAMGKGIARAGVELGIDPIEDPTIESPRIERIDCKMGAHRAHSDAIWCGTARELRLDRCERFECWWLRQAAAGERGVGSPLGLAIVDAPRANSHRRRRFLAARGVASRGR